MTIQSSQFLSSFAGPLRSTGATAKPLSDANQIGANSLSQLLSSIDSTAAAGIHAPGRTSSAPASFDNLSASIEAAEKTSPAASGELKEAFRGFVGQTFFSELIKSYRSTQKPTAYFNGGRAEQIFQGQLDQVLSEALSESSADKIADPMFELFMLRRSS